MATFAIYKEGTQEWVQSLDPFTVVDLSNVPDLDPVEILEYESEQAAQADAYMLTDQEQVNFAVGPRPRPR